jgi:hypothetical protein
MRRPWQFNAGSIHEGWDEALCRYPEQSPGAAMQFKRMAKEWGTQAFQCYFDASSDPHWKKHAEDWVKSGIDSDE